MIAQVRDGALRAARTTGFTRLVKSSSWRSSRVLVLCYHGISVADEHEWDPALFMSRERFRARMEILRDEGCTVLSLGEAVRRCDQGALPPRSVVITFDDGTTDFVECAVPILQKFGYPATLYLTTYYCDLGVPVPTTATSYLLWKARAAGYIEFAGLFGIDGRRSVDTVDDRRELHRTIAGWLKDASTTAKTEAIEALSQRAGFAPGGFVASRLSQIMSAAEVRALPADQIDVELHTHRHRTPADPELFLRELRDNEAVIQDLRGRVPRHFCYPDGVFRSEMAAVLDRMHILSATTCRSGLLSPTTNRFLIPRVVDTMNGSEETFRGWIAGTANLLPRRA
jgi:peptidoglycan/xylan/chitin deacetylase (PgdA/CDA1 family)